MRIKHCDAGRSVERQIGTNRKVHSLTGWLGVEFHPSLVEISAEVTVTYDLDAGDHRQIVQETRMEPLATWAPDDAMDEALVRWLADEQIIGAARDEAARFVLRHALESDPLASRLRGAVWR